MVADGLAFLISFNIVWSSAYRVYRLGIWLHKPQGLHNVLIKQKNEFHNFSSTVLYMLK